MKILLTGATGFLGNHLLRGLLADGHQIMAWRRTKSDLSAVADTVEQCRWFNGDTAAPQEAFETFRPDVVIHCATVYGRDGETAAVLEGNLQFPVKLLDCAVRTGCRYFINTDSFFCKQLPERLEQGRPLYLPEYTLSKYQFREWGRLRAEQGTVTFVNLQLEHVYGSGDRPGKFFPWLEEQFRNNVPSVNLTDGTQLRDFVPVEGVVLAYRQVVRDLLCMRGYQSFEVGTGTAVTLRSFVERLRDSLGASTRLCFGAIPRKPEEILYSVADADSPYILPKLRDLEGGFPNKNDYDCYSNL